MLAAVEKIVKTRSPEIQYIVKGFENISSKCSGSLFATRQLKMTCV